MPRNVAALCEAAKTDRIRRANGRERRRRHRQVIPSHIFVNEVAWNAVARERDRDRACGGDVVYLEVSGVVRRYHCNISRTVVVGEPSPRIRELYTVVEEALRLATEALRPGTSVAEIVELVEECHRGYEQNTWGRIGFSMEIAYPPIWIGALSLMRGDPHTIEAGMVITMEPGLSYSDGATMMLGNNVLVTEDGPEVLNEVPVELFCK